MSANNFFRGMAQGIQQGQEMRLRQQQLEMEKQRMEQQAARDGRDAETHRARMDDVGRENRKRDEVAQASKGMEPVREVTVVADPEGKWQQPYNDPEEAKRVAEQLGATVGTRYYSGDKDFGADKTKAERLVEASQGPDAASRRIARVYESYGDSVGAKAALDLGSAKVASHKANLQNQGDEALRRGGAKGYMQFFNSLNDGNMVRGFERTQDGKYIIDSDYEELANRPLSMEEIVGYGNAFIKGSDAMVHMYDRQRANTMEDKKLGLQERGVKVQERGAAVGEQNADTQEGYRVDQAENMRGQRRLQEMGLGIQASQAAASIRQGDQRLQMDSYTPINTGVDAAGNNVVTVMNRRMKPGADGGVPQGAIVTVSTGVRPPQKPLSLTDQYLSGAMNGTPGINPAAGSGQTGTAWDAGLMLPNKRTPAGPYKQ